MICEGCGGSNPNPGRYCRHCGLQLRALCAGCSEPLPEKARFCPSCGTPTEAQTAPRNEMLKLATILFVDIVGSTGRAEVLDPEVVHMQLSDFFDAMVSRISSEGGTIEKFLGDAIMAVFGVPTAYEDDPLRAVRAARGMLEELEDWNSRRAGSQPIQVRIGINSGRVLASGRVGDDLFVTGDPVNVASRLQTIARPGTIVVGERTARAISDEFELSALGPQILKGRTEPVAAFEVVGPRRDERPQVSRRVPLVGRQTELQLARTLFDRLLDQQEPQLILVTGEAGVGKSRFALEVADLLEPHGARLLVGRCLGYGQNQSLAPLAEILRKASGVMNTETPSTTVSKLEAFVAEAMTVGSKASNPDERTAAALAATLGLRYEEDPFEDTDPREVYRQISNTWRSLLSAMARVEPLLIVIEDVHWADETFRQVLIDLVERSVGPILFLCTSRPDEVTGSRFGAEVRNLVTFPLQPLDETERVLMATSLLGEERLPAGLHEIVERSEGNPFFLEEIFLHLSEQGSLRRTPAAWELVQETQGLPDNVEGVIVSRLDALDPFDKHVIQQAAVVGRFFWDGAVSAAVDQDSIADSLRNLERRQLIVERLTSSMEGETEYAFKHALIRDVAYEGLPRAIRGRSHALIAKWLIEQSGERFEELADPLAHHFHSAFEMTGQEEYRIQGRQMCLLGARSSAQRFALQHAADLGTDAVELSRGGPERLEALEALGDIQNPHSGEAAWKAYLEALDEIARMEGDQGEQIARIAAKASVVATRWQGMMQTPPAPREVQSVVHNGLRFVASGDSRERCLLLSAQTWAQIQGYFPRDEQGLDAATEALAIARRIGDPDLISSILDAKSLWELTERRFGEMGRIIQERLSLVPRLTDVSEVCDVYAMAAWNSMFVGRYPIAVAQATECVERAQGVDVGAFQHGLVWRASARFMAGDWDGCLRDQEQVERVQSEDSRELPPPYVMRPYAFAAWCLELRGVEEGSDRYLSVLRRFHSDPEMPVNLIGSRAPMARALAHRGEVEEARGLLRLQPSQFLCIHIEAFTDVVAQQEDWDAARQILPIGREEAARGELLALGFFLDRLEGRLAAAEDDADKARDLLLRSAEGFGRLGAPWEKAFSILKLATFDHSEDVRRQLQTAHETFQRLGSRREVEEAAKLLAAGA